MKIDPTGQPAGGESGKPILKDPVKVTLDVDVYYMGSGTPQKASRTIICDRAHALLIYAPLNDWCVKHGFALCHLGTYLARKARKANGQPILYRGKPRWSGHAWGACDWWGVKASDGKFYNVNDLKAGAPAKMLELYQTIKTGVQLAGRKLEYVEEPHWRHIGLVPAGGW